MSSDALGRDYMRDYTTSDLCNAIAWDPPILQGARNIMSETYFVGPYETEQDLAQRAESLETYVYSIVASSPPGLVSKFMHDSLQWVDWDRLAKMLLSDSWTED